MKHLAQGADGNIGKSRDGSFQLVESTAFDHHLLDTGHLGIVERRSTDAIENGPLSRIGALVSDGEQRSRLALAEVVADRLSGDGGVSEGPHHVVAHLEGVAQGQTVTAESREEFGTAVRCGEHGTEGQRSFDRVLAALVTADAFGFVAPTVVGGRAHDVEQLSDVEFDAQFVPDLARLGRGSVEKPIGVDEREVADQNRDALAESARLAAAVATTVAVGEDLVGDRGTAPTGGPIHDVVVEQREGVEQLESRTRIER